MHTHRVIAAKAAVAIAVAGTILAFPATAEASRLPPVALVSATNELPNPSPGDDHSEHPSISADGRYITFVSRARNFDPRGLATQIYLRDTVAGTTTLVSTDGTRSGALVQDTPVISGDGNFVAYYSNSQNLAPGGNGRAQVLRWSRATGRTEIVSLSALGTPADIGVLPEIAISSDGSSVAFRSQASLTGVDTLGVAQLYLRDMATGTTTLVSADRRGPTPVPSGVAIHPAISMSSDAKVIAFESEAQLTPTPTSGLTQIYTWNASGPTLTVSSLASTGRPGNAASYAPSLSSDGKLLAFQSDASDMDGPGSVATRGTAYLRNASAGTVRALVADDRGRKFSSWSRPVLSGDGSTVSYVVSDGDYPNTGSNPGGVKQVYVENIVRGTVSVVSTKFDGLGGGLNTSTTPSLSTDGKRIAFASLAPDLLPTPPPEGNWQVYLASVDTTPRVARIGGMDRFAVSAAISADFVRSARSGLEAATVFVASGENYPDALSASAAAGSVGASVLLVRHGEIPADVANELRRINPSEIVVVGGLNAVDATVESQLKTFSRISVRRISGADRFVGSTEVSEAYFKTGVGVAYVASGENYPDALAGSAAAGKEGGPILLTRKDALPAEVGAELARLKPGRIVLLGGNNAVSEAVRAGLEKYAPVTRQGGADRFEVAAGISKTVFPAGARTVYVASGENFPDALSGSAAAISARGPVLLVRRSSIDAAIRTELDRLDPTLIVVLGGVNAVSDSVKTELEAYLAK